MASTTVSPPIQQASKRLASADWRTELRAHLTQLIGAGDAEQLWLLDGWDTLPEAQARALGAQIESISWASVGSARQRACSKPAHASAAASVSVSVSVSVDDDRVPFALGDVVIPAVCELSDAHMDDGAALLRGGHVACFTFAGGMGSRLGFSGPKGTMKASPVRDASLFQLFAEQIAAAQRVYACVVPWVIMTSASTHEATVRFFERNGFFTLRREHVFFVEQGNLPALDRETGRVLLSAPHTIAMTPNGHGGAIAALQSSGVLTKLRDDFGVQYLSAFQVDNPLVHCVDERFLGLVHARGVKVGVKVLAKQRPTERFGNFAVVHERMRVIEYSDMPLKWAEMHANGQTSGPLLFAHGGISIYVFSLAFLAAADAALLRPHVVRRAVPFFDAARNVTVQPAQHEINAVKMELFVFDVLEQLPAADVLLVRTERHEEYSPIKNGDEADEDTLATAHRDQTARTMQWLAQHPAASRLARLTNGVVRRAETVATTFRSAADVRDMPLETLRMHLHVNKDTTHWSSAQQTFLEPDVVLLM